MESDEQVKLGSATDETFWLMARELAPHTGSAGSSALLSVSRSSRSAALLFTVSHYAGRVTYDTKGFVGKNGDKVLEDQRAVLLSSASALLGSLFDERPDGLASAAAPSAAPAAVGAAEMIKGEWIKPGATVIDVGVNSKPAPEDPRGMHVCMYACTR